MSHQLSGSNQRDRLGQESLVQRYAYWILPAPAAIVLALMVIFPVTYTFWMSAHQWTPSAVTAPSFIFLENFVKLLSDEQFLGAVWRTLVFCGLTVLFQVVLGLVMALVFHREFMGQSVVRTIFLLPMMATPVATSLTWLMMYDPTSGIFNYLLGILGVSPMLWVSDPSTVIPALVLVDTWRWTPLVMLILLAGLATLPEEPYESARIDGASALQTFWYITLPLLRPTLVIAVLFRSMDALKTFDTIFVITGGGPVYASETLNIYAFRQGFQYFDMGYASAVLVAFFALVLTVSVLLIRLRRALQ